MDYECRVCSARATGKKYLFFIFLGNHFGIQSCSACCAFFRRAISLKHSFKCFKINLKDEELCHINYSNNFLNYIYFS